MAEQTDVYLKVKKEDIAFITTIIESFEGVASVRTPNPDPKSPTQILHCIVSPNCTDQFDMIVRDLCKDHSLKRITPDEISQAS
jgi:hypothetical protein